MVMPIRYEEIQALIFFNSRYNLTCNLRRIFESLIQKNRQIENNERNNSDHDKDQRYYQYRVRDLLNYTFSFLIRFTHASSLLLPVPYITQ